MVVAIVGVNLIYTFTSVKLTPGQSFHYFYDQGIDSYNETSLNALLTKEAPENTFSFEVQQVIGETLTENYNFLATRMVAKEGDAIITHITVNEDVPNYNNFNRANVLIDTYERSPIYSYDEFLKVAKEYLARFYDNGSINEDAVLENLEKRISGDNRFRGEEGKKLALSLEIKRIEKIKENADLLEKLLNYDSTLSDDEKLFYTYTRYEQIYNTTPDGKEKDEYYNLYKDEVPERFGLKTARLIGGDVNYQSANYFKRANQNPKDVVILLFDMTKFGVQQDLQFEELSFINTIVSKFSNLKTVI